LRWQKHSGASMANDRADKKPLSPSLFGDAEGARGVALVVVWILFFWISLGLGYPTLLRYDARLIGGLSDSASYYHIVVGGSEAPGPGASGPRPVCREAVLSIGEG